MFGFFGSRFGFSFCLFLGGVGFFFRLGLRFFLGLFFYGLWFFFGFWGFGLWFFFGFGWFFGWLSGFLGGEFLGLCEEFSLCAGYGPGFCSSCGFLLGVFVLDAEAKEDFGDGVAWNRTFAEPIFDAFAAEDNLLFWVLFEGVVVAELFKYSAVAWVAGLDRIDSKEGAMPPSNPGHSDFDRHDVPFCFRLLSIPPAFRLRPGDTFSFCDRATNKKALDSRFRGNDTGNSGQCWDWVVYQGPPVKQGYFQGYRI